MNKRQRKKAYKRALADIARHMEAFEKEYRKWAVSQPKTPLILHNLAILDIQKKYKQGRQVPPPEGRGLAVG